MVRPIFLADGQRLGTLVLVFSLREENAAFAAARSDILLLSAAAAVLTAVLLMALSRFQIVLPLEQLVSAARKLGAGDRAVQVKVLRKDELGRLARVFNDMSAAILERESKLEMATRSLRELFDHMHQAIISFGADGKLEGVASRQAFLLFGAGASPGTHLVELLYGADRVGVEAEALEEWLDIAFASSPRDCSSLRSSRRQRSG